MALDCSKINVGFDMETCTDLAKSGTGARVILLSFTDIDKVKSVVTDNVISSIVLNSGAQGYEVDSLPNATVGEDSINAGTYVNTHTHQVTARIFQKSEAAKKFINGLTNARVVAIVENNETGEDGDVKYEVYGWDSGLKINSLTASTEISDNIAYEVVLASDDTAHEGSLPKSFFDTDIDTTEAALEALLVAA